MLSEKFNVAFGSTWGRNQGQLARRSPGATIEVAAAVEIKVQRSIRLDIGPQLESILGQVVREQRVKIGR